MYNESFYASHRHAIHAEKPRETKVFSDYQSSASMFTNTLLQIPDDEMKAMIVIGGWEANIFFVAPRKRERNRQNAY